MRELRPGLFQGDISDLNLLKLDDARTKLKFTLVVNVGSTNFIPPNIWAVHVPMMVSSREEDNDWQKVIHTVSLAGGEVERGGKVLVTCDAGISRSAVFCGLVISWMEGIPMDDKLLQRMKNRNPAIDPLPELWAEAAQRAYC